MQALYYLLIPVDFFYLINLPKPPKQHLKTIWFGTLIGNNRATAASGNNPAQTTLFNLRQSRPKMDLTNAQQVVK